MIRTSEIPGKSLKDKSSFISDLIIGLKSTLNGTHTEKEESSLKTMIKNGKNVLQEINRNPSEIGHEEI